MQCKIFLEDLNKEMISRLKWVLRYDLADEIDEFAALHGLNRDVVEEQLINDYLKKHNKGFDIKL